MTNILESLNEGIEGRLIKVQSEMVDSITPFPCLEYNFRALSERPPILDSRRILYFELSDLDSTILKVAESFQTPLFSTLNCTIRIDHLKGNFNIETATKSNYLREDTLRNGWVEEPNANLTVPVIIKHCDP